MKKTSLLFSFLLLLLVVEAQKSGSWVGPGKAIDPYRYTIVKSAVFQQASVASAHPLASQVGAVVMKNGGNAGEP